MNQSDWKYVEDRLRYAHGRVQLVCDEYRLDLQVEMIADRQYAIVPYVNGWLRVAWGLQDCEERRRFLDAVAVKRWRPGHFKGISKSSLKSMNIDMDQRSIHYRPWWTSFKRLKAHLVKNNKEISLGTKSHIECELEKREAARSAAGQQGREERTEC